MLRVGFIGWRGMVGSVLLQRMREESAFVGLDAVFFSTSNPGDTAPVESTDGNALQDARELTRLASCDVLVCCQGGDYTTEIYTPLRSSGWHGYWIDAASTLRMDSESIIILDPINRDAIHDGLASGVKAFIGGNCTTSLMLMGVGSLFQAGLVEWLTSMTYQAASGAGSAEMIELVRQMDRLVEPARANPAATALEIDHGMLAVQRSDSFPAENIGAPLAGSLLPWIDRELPNGQSREEWKGMAESNKVLGLDPPVPVDGICVRVGTMRCHSQGLCIKLNRDVPLADIEQIISSTHSWTQVVPNDKESTLRYLTPTAVSGTLTVPVGRLHKLALGPEYLGAFTVGDQLLWGAAEPLLRMIGILREHLGH